MEYLPLPQTPALPPIEVEWQDPSQYWNDGTWEEHINGTYWDNFPKRYGYKHNEFWSHGPHSNKAWAYPEFYSWILHKSKLPRELESIAIGWLFFGTLAEVTRCSLDITDYIHRNDDGRYILKLTSNILDTLLVRWFIIASRFKGSVYVRGSSDLTPGQIFKVDPQAFAENRDGVRDQAKFLSNGDIRKLEVQLDAQGRSLQFERAHKCLQRSKAIIGLICEAIDTKTVYVIATLHEFLATALTEHVFKGDVVGSYDMNGKYALGTWVEGADFTHYNRGAVRALGWCPRTSGQMWPARDRTLALDYFVTNLKTHQSLEDHSKCSEHICLAYQLDARNYRVVHTSNGSTPCKCSHFEVDPKISSQILQRGTESFPLVTISSIDENSNPIQVLDAAIEKEYVAISHVWSHGLGNPGNNSLPNCQLQRIQQLANDLGSRAKIKRFPVPFWMDTLCCPREPKESRRSAIMKMAKTYERATCVLVLDQNLCAVSTEGISKLETLMRMYRTTWMTRLWTLQEARLAKQIWFQFKNKALNLEDLHKDTESLSSLTEALIMQQITASLWAKLNSLREQSHKTTLPRTSEMQGVSDCFSRFITLGFSLGGRSTSWATDEAVCISTILGLDLEPILKISDDAPSSASLRMLEMWKQWIGIPQAIVFNRAPRISQKGYRWAHSTLIRTSTWSIPNVDAQKVAVVDSGGEGLLVSLPSFSLSQAEIVLIIAENDIRLEKGVSFASRGQGGAGKPESHMTFMMYEGVLPGPIAWYDVQIDKPVHTTMPDFNRDDELAIVYSGERNQSNAMTRHMPGLLVSIRKRGLANRVLYVTSLYHVSIARSEAAMDKLSTGALKVRAIIQRNQALQGEIRDGKIQPGAQYNPSSASFQRDMAMVQLIARDTLDDPEVKSYNVTTILKNRDPEMLRWLHASPERRDEWDYRVDHGDAQLFFNHVNLWLNASVRATHIPQGNVTYCID